MNETRREFLRRMNGELDSIDAQLDEFRTQVRNESTMGVHSIASDELDALERRREEIRRRSTDLENLAVDDWEAMRREIENARNDLRRAVDEARNPPRH